MESASCRTKMTRSETTVPAKSALRALDESFTVEAVYLRNRRECIASVSVRRSRSDDNHTKLAWCLRAEENAFSRRDRKRTQRKDRETINVFSFGPSIQRSACGLLLRALRTLRFRG